jgi:hypothetical protein
MKSLLILILLFIAARCWSQFMVGAEISDYAGFVMQGEIDVDIAILQLKTTISADPTFQTKIGFKTNKHKLHGIIYIPMLNYSLEQTAYNTPIATELRYKTKDYWFVLGSEFYLDKPRPYFNVLLNFK